MPVPHTTLPHCNSDGSKTLSSGRIGEKFTDDDDEKAAISIIAWQQQEDNVSTRKKSFYSKFKLKLKTNVMLTVCCAEEGRKLRAACLGRCRWTVKTCGYNCGFGARGAKWPSTCWKMRVYKRTPGCSSSREPKGSPIRPFRPFQRPWTYKISALKSLVFFES